MACLLMGLFEALVLLIATAFKLIASISKFFTEDWTWGELLVFPLQVFVIGFAAGFMVGLLLPMSRIGSFGDFLIGIVAGNALMLACVALFGDLGVFLRPGNPEIIAILIASCVGGLLVYSCAKEFKKADVE